MTRHYTYLLSSLPMLHFQAPSPFTFEEFMQRCQGLIGEDDIAMVRAAAQPQQCRVCGLHPTLQRWHSFECALRNELVKIRAQRKHIDAQPYLREGARADVATASLARRTTKTTSILEAEKMLDEARWQFLDELSFGHYFDRQALLAYALKLLITIRWQRIREVEASKVIADTIAPPDARTREQEGHAQ